MATKRRTAARAQLTASETDAARRALSRAGGDWQPSGVSRMFLGTVNGAEALAVGVLHIARDALVTAIGGATDITVKVVSVATGAARGAVGATARVGGEVLGLATAAAQAAAGTGNRVAKGARVQQREEHDRSQSATGEGRRGKPWRRSRRVRSLARRRVRAVGKKPSPAAA